MKEISFGQVVENIKASRSKALLYIEHISGTPGSLMEVAKMKRLVKQIDKLLEDFS